MAIPVNAVARRKQYTVGSSGQQGPYAFTFNILADADLAVYVNSTLKSISTHYTVTTAANGTGSITFVVGQYPSEDDTVTLIGAKAIARTSDFTAGGDIKASTFNTELDTITIVQQQLEEIDDRSLQLDIHTTRDVSGATGPLIWPYDSTSNNANKLVAYTAAGSALELVDKNTSALGGSNTHVQFNSGGTALGGSANLTFDGTNLSSAGIDLNGNLDVATQATDILMIDNNAAALEIKEGSNAYLTMVTTNSGEKITLGKKLEAGSVEIEGSAFDIDGGDISAATISGSLTWSAAQNLNSQALTNVDINSGSVDGATIGAASPSTIVGTTITANTSLLPDAVGGADIGSTSAEWGDVFIADDKAIKLGNDQDFTIEYDEDGLNTTRVVAAGGVTMSPHGTSAGNTTEMRFLELAANGNNYTGFKAPDSVTGTSVYQMPPAYPASNKILQSTDAGILTWETAATSGATLANDGNNRVTTATGSGGINGEANLSFDGTTLAVTGRITASAQPLFLVRSPGASNVTGGGGQYTVVASTELADLSSSWSSDTFTAPVTGKFLLGGSIYVSGLTSSMTSVSFGVVTSNYTAGYWFLFANIGALRDNNNAYLINGSMICDMDASDTAVFKIQINGDADTCDIGASDTNLFGALLA